MPRRTWDERMKELCSPKPKRIEDLEKENKKLEKRLKRLELKVFGI